MLRTPADQPYEMDLRMKVFLAAFERSRLFAMESMSDRARVRARRPLPSSPLTRLVSGSLPAGVTTVDREVPTRSGTVAVRVYRPAASGPLPVVLNIHGGGFVLGNLDQSQWWCGQLASQGSAVVVSVDYRLAPEHPYPAGREDCWDVLTWLAEHAGEVGGDPGDLSVTGDSAGGNLAAVTALMARDVGGPALRCALLVYPTADLSPDGPTQGHLVDAPVLPQARRDAFTASYLGGADSYHPYVSPLRAESFEGLPRTLVQCAEHDPLTPDGRALAAALGAAGVEVAYREYARMPHGFTSFPGVSRAAPQAAADAAAFFRGDLR